MVWVRKTFSLFFGYLLYAVGILLTIHAALGVSPWDTFHLGIVGHSALSLGQASQLVGLIIVLLCILLGEIPGWGTLTNMFFIGFFIDIIEAQNIIPQPEAMVVRLIMVAIGIILMGWATYFYLSAGLGSGPRDGLMLALSRRLGTKVVLPRTVVEVAALVVGYLLGGPVGVGTLLTAFLVGPSIQLAYSICKHDPRDTNHRTLVDDYHLLFPAKGETKGGKVNVR